jgi:hypothetical protein
MIQNCSLRDELSAAAMSGDQDALRTLLGAMPRDLPADVRRRERDRRIRRLAGILMSLCPGWSDHRVAQVLAYAGSAIESGAGLHGRKVDGLDATDRELLAHDIRAILQFAPQRADGTRWPRWRRILDILS